MNDPAASARPPIEADRVLEIVAAVAREARPGLVPHATLDSSLEKELGLDSLARVELMLRLERAFGASLPEQALATAETPRDLLRFLASSIGAAPRATDTSVASLVRGGAVRPPAHAQTLVEALEYHVERQPDRLTVHLYEEDTAVPITYRALWEGATGYAASLAAAGLAPGERVAIMLPTCKEYLYCFYGALIAGAIPVPLYPPARLSTIEDHMTRHVGILRSAGAALMVTIPEAKALAWLLRAQVETMRGVLVPADLEGGGRYVPHAARAGDIAFLQYTSGTTGNPKGVVLTHENLLANVRAMAAAAKATDQDVFVSWLPLYHDMGLIGGCFATMYLGFPVVLMSPLAFLARPARWLHAIHRHRGTISGGPNFAYELCLRRIADEDMEGMDLSSWRFAFNGAEPVLPETLEGFAERFARWGFRRNALAPVYGLAECAVGLAFTPPGEPWRIDRVDRETFTRRGEAVPARADDPAPLRFVGCGTPIPGHYVRVVDAAGLELPERHEGSLQFRGPSATSGYYRNPEATRKLFSGEWLNTGDRAYLADGHLFLTGREKDLIIRGGRNISPYELEQAVGNLAGVRRGCVAVFGVRDAASGTERVVVLAEMREADPSRHDALRRMINELAVNLIGGPADDIVFAPPGTVPKTSSGKIRRNAAREYYERGSAAVKPQPVWLQFARLMLAGAAPQLRRLLRALAGLAFALRGYVVFALAFPIAFVAALTAPVPACWAIGSFASRWFLRLAGIPVLASGLENLPRERPVVLAVNHTSYLDPVVLLALLADYRGYAFVAKREFLRNWLMRRLLAGFGTLFVERFEVAKSAEHASELAEAARRGTSLIVFPEGTLTRNAGLMEFRTGAFQAAAAAGVPVVPVALRGVRSVMRDGTWYLRRVPVSVHFGAPIAPEGADWAAAVRLRDAVRAEILRHCGEPDLTAARSSA
jgi:1-acyl-sn-glycerol-3-phosphate acyltransferase